MGPFKVHRDALLAHGNKHVNKLRLDVKDFPQLLVVQQDFLLGKDANRQVCVLTSIRSHLASMKLPEVFLDLTWMNAAPDRCCNQCCLVLVFAKVGFCKSIKLVGDAVLIQQRLSNLNVVLRASDLDAFCQQPFQVVRQIRAHFWNVCFQHITKPSKCVVRV